MFGGDRFDDFIGQISIGMSLSTHILYMLTRDHREGHEGPG